MTTNQANKPLLLLFDGNALVHRAFHALPPLSVAKTGEMVNAVRGFASTLLKLLRENKPTYWAIAFDRPAPTFRHEKYADYKKQRPPTPRELISQIERVHHLAAAFNLPAFEIDGYEADDILGTLSKKASEQGIDTLIVTGDNDMLQIISPLVKVMTPKRSFNDTTIFDELEVQKKYGIKPKELIDLKALVGDPSDNIRGIPGVGDKTAMKLLQQFKNLDGIYAHIEEVTPPRLQALLREHKQLVYQNRDLVTIVTDVPIIFNLENCKVSAYDRNQVVELFRELEFAHLLSTLPGDMLYSESSPVDKHELTGVYRIINSDDELDRLIKQLMEDSEFAVDLETTTVDVMAAEIVGISISSRQKEAFYIPTGHRILSSIGQLPFAHVINKLKPLLEDIKLSKVVHNGKFDLAVLAGQGIQLQNLGFDTVIAAHLLGEKPLLLKALAFNKLGIEMTAIEDLIGKGAKQISMALVDIEKVANYACADADVTLRLKTMFAPELAQTRVMATI